MDAQFVSGAYEPDHENTVAPTGQRSGRIELSSQLRFQVRAAPYAHLGTEITHLSSYARRQVCIRSPGHTHEYGPGRRIFCGLGAAEDGEQPDTDEQRQATEGIPWTTQSGRYSYVRRDNSSP